MSATHEVHYFDGGTALELGRGIKSYCDWCGSTVVAKNSDGTYRAVRAVAAYVDGDTGNTYYWHEDHFPPYLRALGDNDAKQRTQAP